MPDAFAMHVDQATEADIPGWLKLAAEVEFLFGPMISDPGFHDYLRKNIARSTAFCVREDDGSPGRPLIGGLGFSSKPSLYRIGWLSVAEQRRRNGIGQCLLEHVFGLVKPPAELVVTTFGDDIAAGRPARQFYACMGFHAAEQAPAGPDGGSRQLFRRIFV